MTVETTKRVSETEVSASTGKTVSAKLISEVEPCISSKGYSLISVQRVTSNKTSGNLSLRYAPPEASVNKTPTTF